MSRSSSAPVAPVGRTVPAGDGGTAGTGLIPPALLPGILTRAAHDASVAITVADAAALILNCRRDGRPFWNEFHLSPVRSAAGRVTHYIGYQLDVTDRVERQQQLDWLAS